MSKIFTIFGATGTQGGSVVRELLRHPQLSQEFRLRAITRNSAGYAAQSLLKQGVEIKNADMTSKSSILEAIKGSHTVFLVTSPNFAQPEADDELVQGRNVADAAKDAGVSHVIFSSLLNVTKISDGRLKHVLHFDRKAQVEDYIRDTGIPSTFVLPGYFMSNYTALGMIRRGEDDVYTLAYPVSRNARFPLIDAEADFGKFVVAAITSDSKSSNDQVLAAVDYYTPDRIVSEFTEVTGKQARFVEVSKDTYKSFLPPQMAEEMLENHLLMDGPGYYAGRTLDDSAALVEKAGMKLTTWKAFLEKNATSF